MALEEIAAIGVIFAEELGVSAVRQLISEHVRKSKSELQNEERHVANDLLKKIRKVRSGNISYGGVDKYSILVARVLMGVRAASLYLYNGKQDFVFVSTHENGNGKGTLNVELFYQKEPKNLLAGEFPLEHTQAGVRNGVYTLRNDGIKIGFNG